MPRGILLVLNDASDNRFCRINKNMTINYMQYFLQSQPENLAIRPPQFTVKIWNYYFYMTGK